MKAESLYRSLKELAERLDIVVWETNLSMFRDLKAKSGLCKIHGQFRIILDKRLPVNQRNFLLGEILSAMPHETVFVTPVVREFLQQMKTRVSTHLANNHTDTTRKTTPP